MSGAGEMPAVRAKPFVKEAIAVEGKYDRIRVCSAVDATVVETGGFRVFREPEKVALLRRLAEVRGLIVLTDSDAAGAQIRGRLRGMLPPERLLFAYVPPIPGKERRKRAPSKEGLLGVEGMDDATVICALRRAGAHLDDAPPGGADAGLQLTKTDLYLCGLSGAPDSAARRQALLDRLGLPRYLSAAALLTVVNATLTREEWERLLSAVCGAGRKKA